LFVDNVSFWLIAAAIILIWRVIEAQGERIVEHRSGRAPTPENRIFYSGVFVVVCLLVILPVIYLLPNAGPIIFLIAFCVGSTAATLIAQSFFGTKRA
jgi:hypothetical protein